MQNHRSQTIKGRHGVLSTFFSEFLIVKAHDGIKPPKFTWMEGITGSRNYCVTVGYAKQQQREVKLWDLRMASGGTVYCNFHKKSWLKLSFLQIT